MAYSKLEFVTNFSLAPVEKYVTDKSEIQSLSETTWIAAMIAQMVSLKPSILKGQYIR